ncbi:MAG: 16S rRNA (cytidine(1402)-2'-O)-methyltransferase [Bacillota bacterium]
MDGGNKGVLYLCATPIGNLEDITLRALRLLKEVDLVAAEDTRHTRKLFSHYDIHTPLTSYHEHNSRSKGRYLIDQLRAGKNVALVTDAGLPGVSDPGEKLTALAVSEGIRVVPVPGASASLSALVVSGLPTGRFCFEGFLPARGAVRQRRLEDLKPEKRTLVLYESPHRLAATLSDLLEYLGPRRVCVARELTKQYEEIWRGSLIDAVPRFKEQPPRGEITLVVEGLTEPAAGENRPLDEAGLTAMVVDLEQRGMSRKEAIKETSRRAGVSRREVYAVLVEQKNQGGSVPPGTD